MKNIFQIELFDDLDVKYEVIDYPAGEKQYRILPNQYINISTSDEIHVIVRARQHLMGTIVVDIALLASAIRDLSHSPIILFIPYLPYGRADRRFQLGDCAGLATFGNLLDSIGFDKVVTLDNHSPVSHGKIANLLNVSPLPFIEQAIKSSEADVILLPDEGAKRYSLDKFGLPVLNCSKNRDASTGKLSGFNVPDLQAYKNILIVDDICDGGGTFLGIGDKTSSRFLFKRNLCLYITHGIFSQGMERIYEKFKNVYTTNSFHGNFRYDCIPVMKEAYNKLEDK